MFDKEKKIELLSIDNQNLITDIESQKQKYKNIDDKTMKYELTIEGLKIDCNSGLSKIKDIKLECNGFRS